MGRLERRERERRLDRSRLRVDPTDARELCDQQVAFGVVTAGVTPELFSFLGWVYTLQPVTPGDLAAETGMPPTTIRDYIRRLVERGDVRKVANPADGRSYHLVGTPQGRRLVDRGWPAVVAAFERLEPSLERPAADYLAAVEELRRALKVALARRASRVRPSAR